MLLAIFLCALQLRGEIVHDNNKDDDDDNGDSNSYWALTMTQGPSQALYMCYLIQMSQLYEETHKIVLKNLVTCSDN